MKGITPRIQRELESGKTFSELMNEIEFARIGIREWSKPENKEKVYKEVEKKTGFTKKRSKSYPNRCDT